MSSGRRFAHEPMFTVLRGGRVSLTCSCGVVAPKMDDLDEARTAYEAHVVWSGIKEKRHAPS